MIRELSQNLYSANIMMVDDELTTMLVVQTYLEEAGYTSFTQVEDATRAMEVLEDVAPDILLLDLVMPGMSGFEILGLIRTHQKFKHLPVIILTGSSDAENKLRALELGATDFLAKPVDQSELGLRVRNTLAAKAYIDQLAFYDPLTKLPNRHMFKDRFAWGLQKAIRYNDRLALLVIAIDDLDRINATLGNLITDQVLCDIAARLENIVREVDSITRTTGDRKAGLSLFRAEGSVFSLLLDRTKTAESAALVAQRILTAMETPIQIPGDELHLTVSIGIATHPDEASDGPTLQRLATSAKDYSKTQGGNAFHFSSAAINDVYQRRLRLESKLRKALERDEFILYYQPKLNISTGKIASVEALIRWQNEEEGLVAPGDFIPLLEETGLIVPVGEWVLEEACRQLAQWQKEEGYSLSMAINLSVKQLDSPNLVEIIQRILEQYNLPPQTVTLEITESLLLDDIDKKIALMAELKNMGLKFSIDDFGTGYSSMKYLTRLPLDELKIDRSFITDITENSDNQAIVSSIIFLAKSLQLSTVIEGIEETPQLEFIQQAGGDYYQGFYFSRPVPATELTCLLQTTGTQGKAG